MSNYEDILNKWQSYNIRTENDLDYYLDNFRILFAYNSNHIENPNTTYHDTREVFEHGSVSSYTGDLRTLFEIQNQKECYEFLKNKIINKEPITQELILKMHKKLMNGCYDKAKYDKGERPGTYKKHLFVVGDDIGVEPEDVPDEIEYVLNEVRENEGKNPLTVAAYLHLSFESIHPFADGNGRLGRTLLNYYLMTHKHPPIIVFSEDKETYYMALAVFDKTGKIEGFKKFIEEETVKTWSRREHKRRTLSDNQSDDVYYIEVSKREAEALADNSIEFQGQINEKGKSVLKIKQSDKETAQKILNSIRKTNDIPKI